MSPSTLCVTSVGSEPAAVVPVLAALDAQGASLRAIDVGRLGSSSDATMERVLKAVTGELSERRLAREWAQNPPDVAVAFDPGSAEALVALSRQSVRSAPVVCVVPELAPRREWGRVDAERFLAVDDQAAAQLGEAGVPDDRVLVVGPMAEARFAEAGQKKRTDVRKKFKIGANDLVVLVDVAGAGYEGAAQMALQLALIEEPVLFLFDAGTDTDAATALRAQVPTLDMRAKLFGETDDEPYLWRAANIVVAAASMRSVARCYAVGTRIVCMGEQGGAISQALEDRGRGRTASSPLLISSALEPLLAEAKDKSYRAKDDGAQNVADIVMAVGDARQAILDDGLARGREATSAAVDEVASAFADQERTRRAPGELEDLGSGGASRPARRVNKSEVTRLLRKLSVQKQRIEKSIADAQRSATQWDKRRAKAEAEDAKDVARHAERNADLERSRMHKALAELAEVDAEIKKMEAAESAPPPPGPAPRRGGGTTAHDPVDDLLREMKQSSGGAAPKRKKKKKKRASTVDDELAALKKKMKK